MNIIKKTFDLGDGRMIEIETGKLAKQADGSAVVRMNNTMLLATVCSKREVGENVDFMPLTVDYQEKYAALGRFPGGFFKREARPSEHEILIARLVDRALRPLFPDNFHAPFFRLQPHYRLSTHFFNSAASGIRFSSLPSTTVAPGQLPFSDSTALPKPLPPEVANSTIFFPVKS